MRLGKFIQSFARDDVHGPTRRQDALFSGLKQANQKSGLRGRQIALVAGRRAGFKRDSSVSCVCHTDFPLKTTVLDFEHTVLQSKHTVSDFEHALSRLKHAVFGSKHSVLKSEHAV